MELRGADQLIGALKKRANLNDVKNIVKLNGSELQGKAQRNAPVDTGHLRRSIQYSEQDGGFTAKVAATADYSGYVEWGTRYMYPRRYMGGAFNAQKAQFKRDMARIMK